MNLSEKYRPKTLDEVIGQEAIVGSLKSKAEYSHMLFTGPPGSGKTTIAYLIAHKLNLPIHETNASDSRGIDVIRGEIKRLSKIKGERAILLDEADNLTPEAQAALRRTMEKSKSLFILTGNNAWKIIEPIKSRCACYDFVRIPDMALMRRILEICKAEGITVDEEAQSGLIELIKQANGDMRKAINILSKVIDKDKSITKKGVMSFQKPKMAAEALQIAVNGDFERAQKLVEDAFIAVRLSPEEIIREFYEAISQVQDSRVKVQLYAKLAETERACKIESDPIMPLVQLVGFIATAWVLPHVNNDCPVLRK